jgi:pyruvate formate lyase activating enzyme
MIVKEAFLYEKFDNKSVKCHVCSHHCLIKEQSRGICGVRVNLDGVLYALNYNKTISRAIDPIEKKPIYHFLPGTNTYSFATEGCNLKCAWCQNWEISQAMKNKDKVYGQIITPEEHVKTALRYGCESVSYTYSEPTIFLEYAYETMLLAHKNNLKNIWVSNGYMSNQTLKLIIDYVDAFNIDLKGFDNDAMKKFTGSTIGPVFENLKQIYKSHSHLEITTLVVPSFNDDIEQLNKIANFIRYDLGEEVPWHISRFHPAYLMRNVKATPFDIMRKAEQYANEIGIINVHLGNVF